jgi:hypothetical protein
MVTARSRFSIRQPRPCMDGMEQANVRFASAVRVAWLLCEGFFSLSLQLLVLETSLLPLVRAADAEPCPVRSAVPNPPTAITSSAAQPPLTSGSSPLAGAGPRFRSRSRLVNHAAPLPPRPLERLERRRFTTGRAGSGLTWPGRGRRRGRPRSTTSGGAPYGDSLPDVSRCGVGGPAAAGGMATGW